MPGEESAAAESSRTSTTWLVVCRSAVLVALLASSALYVHYLSPADSGFCGLHSGCEEVRRSAFSYFQSRFLSMPLVGLVAYASVFAVSLIRPSGPELLGIAGIGGVLGVALLGVQAFYVRAFCWLCTVVDVSAAIAGLSALVHRRARATGGGVDPLKRGAWVLLAVLAIVVPLGWTALKPEPPVPSVILKEYLPDKINVVEFADFECPFCRKLHPLLKQVILDYPNRVHFVRKQVPLEMHEMALPAARAAICAEAQGKGEALADRLIDIELSAADIRRAAVGVGVDVPVFDRCLASKDPDARIAADRRLLEDAGMEGLPTTYIGGTRVLGVVSEAALRDAFDRAARNEGSRGIPAPAYAALAAALFGVAAWLGRSRRGSLKDGS